MEMLASKDRLLVVISVRTLSDCMERVIVPDVMLRRDKSSSTVCKYNFFQIYKINEINCRIAYNFQVLVALGSFSLRSLIPIIKKNNNIVCERLHHSI